MPLRETRANNGTAVALITVKIKTEELEEGQTTGSINDALLDQDVADGDREPINFISINDDGVVSVAGNISATTTTTMTTTTIKGTVAPTEPIVLKPTTTKIVVGLLQPYVIKNSNAEALAGGLINLIPVTGQVQDERPIFDLNFNAKPDEGYVFFSSVTSIT